MGASEPRNYGKGFKKEIVFVKILLDIRIPFKLGKCMTLTPLAELTTLLGQYLRKGIQVTGRKTSTFTYEITLSREFVF